MMYVPGVGRWMPPVYCCVKPPLRLYQVASTPEYESAAERCTIAEVPSMTEDASQLVTGGDPSSRR